jgi:photosystem II stability/assembly factor-like uncharacterized protein
VLFRSSWVAAGSAGLPKFAVENLSIDSINPSTLYVASWGGVFKSTDSGATWAGSLGDPQVFLLAISRSTPTTLYAATHGFGVVRSVDAGLTWTQATALTNRYLNALAVDPTTPKTLYAGTGDYLSSLTWGVVYKSTDAGDTWTSVKFVGGAFVTALAIDPANPGTVYAGTFHSPLDYGAAPQGIFKSTDAGGTWAPASTGLEDLNVHALAVDPATPATLYAGTGAGVFKSTNAGGSWAPANTGLENLHVGTFLVDPTNPATVYAGTGAGVFKSTDQGGSWSSMGLADQSVTALALDPRGPTTLYAAPGNGVWQFTPGPPSQFFVLPPCRLIDTRGAAGPLTGPALVAGATRSFTAAGSCGVPATARTLSVNLTVTSPGGPGHLRVFPAGYALPTISAINYSAGQTRANNAIVTLGAGGAFSIYAGQAVGTVDVILDLNGYFQ